jgi:uncharacterized protein YbjT (DUF2867 family)
LKVLVTGATGFAGGHLVELLVRHGYAVRALARQTSDTSLLEKLEVEIAGGDIRDAAAMEQAMAGCQRVYHLAGKTTKHHLSKKVYVEDLVEGLRQCGEANAVEGKTYILAGPEPAKLRRVLDPNPKLLPEAWPLLLLSLAILSAGEMMGYGLGMGKAEHHTLDYDGRRGTHLSRRDRELLKAATDPMH